MANTMLQRQSILDLAGESGLFDINPSDLVFESSTNGHIYYDYVLSCSRAGATKKDGCVLYLAKFDSNTNLEEFESVRVAGHLFEEGLPDSDLAMMTLGILTWKSQIAKSRVLCLVRRMDGDCNLALEALKRATNKFRILHHVQAAAPRRPSITIYNHKKDSRAEAMRMRILLCQSRSVLEEIPGSAIRETTALLNPSSNFLLCLCFPLL